VEFTRNFTQNILDSLARFTIQASESSSVKEIPALQICLAVQNHKVALMVKQ